MQFNTSNQTYRQIMGNGLTYRVPKFQRDYAWDYDQWEDLWQDLTDSEDEVHYMGYLVLQSVDARTFSVIDGQQRLTTLSILILAVLGQLDRLAAQGEEADDNRRRIETLEASLIGFVDPVSLVVQPKLTLNRNNDRYFRRFLCRRQHAPSTGISRSERRMGKALSFFTEQLERQGPESGINLARFVDRIIDRLLFTTITVGSDLNAYRVFETLNARGVKLSVPDLVKNYLFSLIDQDSELHDQEIQSLEEEWASITATLGKEDFASFMQAEWNSREPAASRTRLFKQMKAGIRDRESAYAYIERLADSTEVYAALQDASHEYWDKTGLRGGIEPLVTLGLFRMKQFEPLALAARRTFDDDMEFAKVLGYIEVISVRHTVIGERRASDLETAYQSGARSLTSGAVRNLQGVKRILQGVYVPDTDFERDFAHKKLATSRSPKRAKRLLAKLARTLDPDLPLDETGLTLEHVLPKRPNQHWDPALSPDLVDRLGNMTLMESGASRVLGTQSFEAKQTVYREASLALTSQIADYDTWDADSVQRRQQEMAQTACQTWRIEFE